MTILGIETSCDETSIAVVEASLGEKPFFDIRSNIVASQIDVHKKFGGVVPNLAAREHVQNLPIVLEEALATSRSSPIDLIAVTTNPGLIPCLLIGTHFARTLAWRWQKPIIGVDHMEGHLYSALLAESGVNPKSEIRNPKQLFPAISLVVSGGHTMLVLVRSLGDHTVLGETVDDAAGEAFDKVARMLGLGYPGGPAISREAEHGNPAEFDFPRPMLDSEDYRFSFSGLKTAVLYTLRDIAQHDDHDYNHDKSKDAFTAPQNIVADVAASFEEAVVDTLVAKTQRAVEEYGAKSIWLSGGVAANTRLRERLEREHRKAHRNLLIPPMGLCTDNGAMIAVAGALKWIITNPDGDWRKLEAAPLHHLKPWI